ncbi:MAG: LacI family transcriptional regulator, partial [Thermus sp.]
MKRSKMPTIREIARIANVSVSTVSRALNGRPGVSRETQERVMEAVRTLGYAPNPVARELVGKPSTVGLLLAPEVRRYTPYFVLLLENLAEELWRVGLRVKEV